MFKLFKKKPVEYVQIKEDYRLRGVDYYLQNIYKLKTSNPLYRSKKKILESGKAGEKVFQYTFVNKPVYLIPEPKNPYDKNAIAVQVAGEMVGHIPAESAKHVGNILKNNRIIYVSAWIHGGTYKVVSLNGDAVIMDGDIKVDVRICYMGEVK